MNGNGDRFVERINGMERSTRMFINSSSGLDQLLCNRLVSGSRFGNLGTDRACFPETNRFESVLPRTINASLHRRREIVCGIKKFPSFILSFTRLGSLNKFI